MEAAEIVEAFDVGNRLWRASARLASTWWDTGPARRRWDVVIINEAQRIKNPLENRLDDLISALSGLIAPGFEPSAIAVGLRRLLGEVQLHRPRREVLFDLPPKFVSTVTVDLIGSQGVAYRRAEEEGVVWSRSLGRELRIIHALELVLRLKRYYGEPFGFALVHRDLAGDLRPPVAERVDRDGLFVGQREQAPPVSQRRGAARTLKWRDAKVFEPDTDPPS
jgi:hypothetical protein